MKILIINELIAKGGTEIQCHREKEYFCEKGHDVYLLTFDPSAPLKLTSYELNFPCKFHFISKIYHRFYSNRSLTNKIKQIINTIKPDVIHLNNVWRVALDVMKAIQEYPVVQTIRDYGVVCPKLTCINNNHSICRGYLYEDCTPCVKGALELKLKLSAMKRLNRARKKSINYFISPSQALADVCTQNTFNTICLNDLFDFSKVKSTNKTLTKKKVFMQYGLISKIKGVDQFLSVIDELENTDIEVWFIGEIEKSYQVEFFNKIAKHSFIKYLGIKSFEDIMILYAQVYCVVVPSLWIENYPNTILEAIANRTLVIGSNRGGIPELIKDKRFLFDILNLESFKNSINTALNIDAEQYKTVTEQSFSIIYNNNAPEMYYQRLMKIYNTILAQNSSGL